MYSQCSSLIVITGQGSFNVFIAERLSARLLIVQCRQFAFVCMYILHILIAWARFLWSCPQTTNHVVPVRPEGDRKIVRVREPKWSRGNMVLVRSGGDRRVKKIVREPKWSRSSPKRDRAKERRRKQSDTASEENKARRESDILARHFAHFLKRFRRHLHRYTSSPELSTYMLHVVTTDIHLHISGYSSARGTLCACVFLVEFAK